jgi:hypothetical protein
VRGYEDVWSRVFMREECMTKRWHGCIGKIGGGAVELCLSGAATRIKNV